MADIELVDSTWIGVPATRLAPLLADPANWTAWWPGFGLTVAQLRGDMGVRWRVDSAAGGRLSGAMEVWLQSQPGGVIVHYILQLDPAGGQALSVRRRRRLEHTYRVAAKRLFWGLGDRLDPSRLARLDASVPNPVT